MSTASQWHQKAAQLIRTLQQRLQTGCYDEPTEDRLIEAMDLLEGSDPAMDKFEAWAKTVLPILKDSDATFCQEIQQYLEGWSAYLETVGLQMANSGDW